MSIIDTHMHIGKSFIYQKNPKKQGLSDQECLEQTLQAFSKYGVKKVITVYRDYNYFKDFQKQAKQSGVEVLGCQWISLAEDLPEVLDYEKDKTVLGVKVHNKRNYTVPSKTNKIINYQDSAVFKKLLERGVPYIQLHMEDGPGTCRPCDLVKFIASYPNIIFHICHTGCVLLRHWKPTNIYSEKFYYVYVKRLGLVKEALTIASDFPNVYTDSSIAGDNQVANPMYFPTIPERLVSASDFLAGDIQILQHSKYNWEYLKENTEKYWNFLKIKREL